MKLWPHRQRPSNCWLATEQFPLWSIGSFLGLFAIRNTNVQWGMPLMHFYTMGL